MFYQNDFIVKSIKTQQVNEYLRDAEKERLLAGLKSHRPNPLIQLARAALRGSGQLVAAIGRRLDRVQPPQVHIGNVAPTK